MPQDSTLRLTQSEAPAPSPHANIERGLQKKDQLDGERVELANGEQWLIPAVDVFPHAVHFKAGEDGKIAAFPALDERMIDLAADVRTQFNVIFAASQALQTSGDAAGTFEMDFYESAGVAFRLLQLNYNITVDMMNMTGLINERCVVRIIMAGIGQKKTGLRGVI